MASQDRRISDALNKAAEVRYLHFIDDAETNAKLFEDIHLGFRRAEKHPDIGTLTKHYASRLFKYDTAKEPLHKALAVMAYQANGERTPDNAHYHNKFHFVDVVAVTGCMLEMHNNLAKANVKGFTAFDEEELAVTLLAAVGHDYRHPGTGNPKDDSVFNEANSFARMKADVLDYFDARISPRNIDKVETILYFTSPALYKYLKPVLNAHEEGREIKVEDIVPATENAKITEKVKAIVENKQLAQMAGIVVSADLYGSTCTLLSNYQMSSVLSHETGINFTNQKAVLGFLENLVGEKMFGKVADRLATPAFNKVKGLYKIMCADSPVATTKGPRA